MRREKFQTGECYHIYNRGVDKRDVFLDKGDFTRFVINMREQNNESTDSQRDYEKRKIPTAPKLSFGYPKLSFLNMPNLIKVIAYCLNSNHYHFLLKQEKENGIAKFMQKIGTSYTKYFNQKHSRSGSLFQGTYKAVHIKSSGQLWQLSCYINGNSEIHGICKADQWPWSSCLDYLEKRNGTLADKNEVLRDFRDRNEYKSLLYDIIKTSREDKSELKIFLQE